MVRASCAAGAVCTVVIIIDACTIDLTFFCQLWRTCVNVISRRRRSSSWTTTSPAWCEASKRAGSCSTTSRRASCTPCATSYQRWVVHGRLAYSPPVRGNVFVGPSPPGVFFAISCRRRIFFFFTPSYLDGFRQEMLAVLASLAYRLSVPSCKFACPVSAGRVNPGWLVLLFR